MENQQEFITITKDKLLRKMSELKNDGYRLAQICATKKENYDIIYSLSKEYHLVNYKLTASVDEEIESVSIIYPYAYLYENEMKDLFGVSIININLDFKGHLYKTSIKTPFKNES